MEVNYGIEQIKFGQAVLVNSEVRCRVFTQIHHKPQGHFIVFCHQIKKTLSGFAGLLLTTPRGSLQEIHSPLQIYVAPLNYS